MITLTSRDVDAVLPLCRRKLSNMERRYTSVQQVARREELAQAGRRDAAAYAIEQMRDLIARLEAGSS